MTLPLENPQMLWLIVPVLVVGLYLIKKGAKTGLVESRLIIALLLIIALSSPYTLVSKTTMDETPNLVIISDETASMKLFEEGTASRIYEALTAKTPTTIVTVSGDKTSIGDAIIQYSRGDNQIVLVTDGNNNYGKTLEDAFKFAKETGTVVYSIEPELKVNDLSVEIKGDKTVVLDNENEIEVVVSQAVNGEISYRIEVDYYDEFPIRKRTISQPTREMSTTFTHTYTSLGEHKIKVTLIPLSGDWDHINNVFYKSIYVVPKPKIHLITDDKESPFQQNLVDLYDVSTSHTLDDIDDKKTIVLDNQHIITLSENNIKTLKRYVTDGHGLVVVGGDCAYDNGEYLNSSFEELLPVMSKPTEWRGGMYVVLLLDMSGSTMRGGKEIIIVNRQAVTEPIYPEILGNAIHILHDDDLKNAKAGVIIIGEHFGEVPDDMYDLIVRENIEMFSRSLSDVRPKDEFVETKLYEGFTNAKDLFDKTIVEEDDLEKYILIISDGVIANYYADSLETVKQIHEDNVNFYFVHIESIEKGQYDTDDIAFAEKLMNVVDGTYKYTKSGERIDFVSEKAELPDYEVKDKLPDFFPLIGYNTKHFITRNIEIAGNITYYNDVTPKAGADRLIITTTGKPVLTTWRYGLGRVASFTTDNGYGGGTQWSSVIYNETYGTPQLTSATLNWAIGNPRVEEGAVLEGMDTWFSTPVTLTLTMYEEGVLPALTLDGTEPLELSVTGKNTYETTIDPDRIGMHDISGYPVAVNYALEYRDVGLNEELKSLVKSSGGKRYTTESEARAYLLTDAKANSERVVQEPVSWKMHFIIAALVLFLLEIVIRRIKEIQAAKRAEKMG